MSAVVYSRLSTFCRASRVVVRELSARLSIQKQGPRNSVGCTPHSPKTLDVKHHSQNLRIDLHAVEYLFSIADTLSQEALSPAPKRNFFDWKLKDLRTRVTEEAFNKGKRKIFRYGDDDDDIITGINSAKQSVLADGLTKHYEWRDEQGDGKKLREWPTGTTPDKAVARGKGGKSVADPERKSSFLILLCCHLGNDTTFDGFVNLCKPSNRQDDVSVVHAGFVRPHTQTRYTWPIGYQTPRGSSQTGQPARCAA